MMMAAGYWQPRTGTKVCVHPMRERRARPCELIQIGGSPHDWFEGRSERCTLRVFIDDATGKLMRLHFFPIETTLGYMRALHDDILAHGVPVAFYTVSFVSMPRKAIQRQKPSSRGRRGNWHSMRPRQQPTGQGARGTRQP